MKNLLIAGLVILSFSGFIDNKPIALTWKNLSDVRFAKKFNKQLGMYFLYPTFGESVVALEGKQIQIKGYLIPADPDNNIYVISAQPMSMCFFCGGAGPESIIELQLRNKKQRFKTDAVKTISGKLRLNAQDIEHLNYILEDAVLIAN
jgi:hypothetical protein